MWIDRIVSDSPEGAQVTDLHERMTVISSADEEKRRVPFDRVADALRVAPGTTMEVRSDYGDTISAHRTSDSTTLFDTRSKLPVHTDDRSLGIVGWLNDADQMAAHANLFHLNAQSLRTRVRNDADLIRLAQTPLDQLFALAAKITTAEEALAKVRNERSELAEEKREREERERQLQAEHDSNNKRGLLGRLRGKKAGLEDTEASEFQLGRLDDLFNTTNLTRDRRSAEDDLAKSWEEWRSIAGEAEPSVLLRDRPRIEELASHLELISVAEVASPGDTSILVGFASLLAELSRRFPAERVPLIIEDLFHDVQPQYHALLRELLWRASHRRQVVLETSDLEVAKWAAVAAVGSDALLITDYDIDVEPIIAEAQAVATENAETV